MNKLLFFFAFAILLSCKKDDNDYRTPILGTYTGLRYTYYPTPPFTPAIDTVTIEVKQYFVDSSLVFAGDADLTFILKSNYSFSALDNNLASYTGQFFIADSLYFHKQTASGSIHTDYYLKK